MVKDAPIGVFDSGVGGLSVLDEIHRLLPHESLLYVADCGHIPYGEKTPAFIRERSRMVAEFFREQGAKAFVIACNTATVAAVADLRQDYPDWPLVGMEPAVKPAAAATRSGVVGVLATTGTLQSAKLEYYPDAGKRTQSFVKKKLALTDLTIDKLERKDENTFVVSGSFKATDLEPGVLANDLKGPTLPVVSGRFDFAEVPIRKMGI